MTIEEAVKVIKENIEAYEDCIGNKTVLMMPIEKPDIEAFYTAIKAIEELQAHREAWEKVKSELWMEGMNMTGEYQGVWVRYRDIERVIDANRPKEGST